MYMSNLTIGKDILILYNNLFIDGLMYISKGDTILCRFVREHNCI